MPLSDVQKIKPIESVSELLIPGFWYVGTPYSKHPGGPDYAYTLAKTVSQILATCRINHHVPIVGCHENARLAGIQGHGDHIYYLALDFPWIMRSHGFLIVKLKNWEESTGLALEYDHFKVADKPIKCADPLLFGIVES